jgi:hypothetical protein
MSSPLARPLPPPGKLDAAEPLLRRALEAYQRTLGGESADTAAAADSLGALLLLQRKAGDAAAVLRVAVAAYEATEGPEVGGAGRGGAGGVG